MLVNEIIRCVISYTGANASIAQTVHWYTLTGQAEDDQDVFDRVEAWATDDWGVRWQDHGAAVADLTTLAVDVINNDGTVARNIGDVLIGLEGNISAQQTSAAVGALLTGLTGTPKIRGRKYVPFWNENSVDNGKWGVAAMVTLTAMAADYVVDLGGMTGGLLESGVLSRVDELFHIFLPVGTADDIPCYQRRRKPNVGS